MAGRTVVVVVAAVAAVVVLVFAIVEAVVQGERGAPAVVVADVVARE